MKNEMLVSKIKMVIFPEHSNNCSNSFHAGFGYGLPVSREKCYCGAFDSYDKTIKELVDIFEEEIKDVRNNGGNTV